MDWVNAADQAFNWYCTAIRKGENHDAAAEWFCDSLYEQIAESDPKISIDWKTESSPEILMGMMNALAARLKSSKDALGYEPDEDFYAAFHAFFSDILYERELAGPEDFNDLSTYWNQILWAELPISK